MVFFFKTYNTKIYFKQILIVPHRYFYSQGLQLIRCETDGPKQVQTDFANCTNGHASEDPAAAARDTLKYSVSV